MFQAWFTMAVEGAKLGLEIQRVIALRMLRVAAGGAIARREITRMATEKMTAAVEAAGTVAAGGSSRKVARRYRTHVRANVRRLSGKKKKR